MGCGTSKVASQAPPDEPYPIFLSFRVIEARSQALALKAALEANGYKTFCSEADVPSGKDWIRTISAALSKCQLMVVFATATYGFKGTDAFATGEELAMAKRRNKALYVIPMADVWQDEATDMMLGTMQMGRGWTTAPNQVPQDLLDDILVCCKNNGLIPNLEGRQEMDQAEAEQQNEEAKVKRILKEQQDLLARQQNGMTKTAKQAPLHLRLKEQQRLTESGCIKLEQEKQEWERLQAEKQKELRAQQRKLEAERKRLQQQKLELEASTRPQSMESSKKRGSENGSAIVIKQPPLPLPQHQLPKNGRQPKLAPVSYKLPRCKGAFGGPEGHSDFARSMAFSRDGHSLVTCSDDKTVRVWDVAKKMCVATLKGHSGKVRAIAVSPDGDTLVSASYDKSLRIWSLRSKSCRAIIAEAHSEPALCVAISPSGDAAASGGSDHTIRLFNLPNGRPKSILSIKGECQSIVYHPDGKQLISGGGWGDKTIRVFNVATKKNTPLPSSGAASSLALVDDGNVLISSGADDKVIKIWDLASGACKRTLQGNGNPIYCLQANSSARYVFAASVAKSPGVGDTLRIYDLSSSTCVAVLHGGKDACCSLALSSDGRTLATCSYDKTIRLWDVSSFSGRIFSCSIM